MIGCCLAPKIWQQAPSLRLTQKGGRSTRCGCQGHTWPLDHRRRQQAPRSASVARMSYLNIGPCHVTNEGWNPMTSGVRHTNKLNRHGPNSEMYVLCIVNIRCETYRC